MRFLAILALALLPARAAADLDMLSCAERAADQFDEPHNALSLSGGPRGLLLELAPGAWGKALGRTLTLELNCDSDLTAVQSHVLSIPGVREVSDPWWDSVSQRLWFVARTEKADGTADRDIYSSRRAGQGWMQAQRLPQPVNSPADEYSPVVRGDALYFASARGGDGDLYRADITRPGQAPERLSAAINSQHGEWNLWVSSDEKTIIFESSGRVSNLSVPGDLYLAQKDPQGRWRPALPLQDLNSSGSDLNARVLGDDLVWAQSDPASQRTHLKKAPLAASLARAGGALAGQLLYAGRSSHELGMIGLADGLMLESVQLSQGPHLLAVSPSRKLVAAAAYGVFPKPHAEPVDSNPAWVEGEGGQVLIWDSRSGQALYLDSSCDRPHGVAWESDSSLWLSCEDRESVVRLNLAQDGGGPIERLSTGHPGAHVLAWDQRRRQLLATHTEGGGLWFGGSGSFLPLGAGSEALHVLPGGEYALVGIGPSGEVVRIDLERQQEVARWKTGCQFPISITTDAWDRTWLACFANRELQRIDTVSGKVMQRIELPAGPLHVAAHPALALLYASIPRRNEVLEIPMEAGGVSRAFAAGMESDGLIILLPHQADVE